MADSVTTKKYRGNCHCGAFIYEAELPEIKEAMSCNCSICAKKGYLWVFPQSQINVVKDEGLMTEYTFGGGKMCHKFCSKCGTPVMGTMGESLGLNVRAIQELDIWSLEIKPYDGASLPPAFKPAPYTGPEPTTDKFEGGITYHGSCHCGAVTLAVKLPTSLEDGSYKERIVECNCSICQRNGYIWVYPSNSQVKVAGRDNLSYYIFNSTAWRKTFCKTCGVPMTNEMNPLTDEEVAALPEKVQEFRRTRADMAPVNMRVLDGVDLTKITAERGDGWNVIKPGYVNP